MGLNTLALLIVASLLGPASRAAGRYDYDFTRGDAHGWTTIVRDLPIEIFKEVERRVTTGESLGPAGFEVDRRKLGDYTEEQSHWLINFGLFPLPPELSGTGILCQGNNHSDDLDMWIIRKIDRLKPNQVYRIRMMVQFASNAQAGGMGVGGGEESLTVFLGATDLDPRKMKVLGNGLGGVRFADGILKKEFHTGKNIANGLPYDYEKKPYRLVTVKNKELIVQTNSHGELWLMAGTHSGFESFQAIYYTKVSVQLKL